MRIVVYVLIAIIVAMMVLCYSLMVAASEADERAEQIFKEYMEYKKKHQ